MNGVVPPVCLMLDALGGTIFTGCSTYERREGILRGALMRWFADTVAVCTAVCAGSGTSCPFVSSDCRGRIAVGRIAVAQAGVIQNTREDSELTNGHHSIGAVMTSEARATAVYAPQMMAGTV